PRPDISPALVRSLLAILPTIFPVDRLGRRGIFRDPDRPCARGRPPDCAEVPMNPRPAARLSLQILEGPELPGRPPLVSPTPSAAAPSAPTTETRSVAVTDLTVAQGAKRHYPHIRVAMLAYTGTPVGTFESKLLRESVDLIIPNVSYLDKFEA